MQISSGDRNQRMKEALTTMGASVFRFGHLSFFLLETFIIIITILFSFGFDMGVACHLVKYVFQLPTPLKV